MSNPACSQAADQKLLWGTVLALLVLLLVGIAYLLFQGRARGPQADNRPLFQDSALTPAAYLSQSRDEAGQGRHHVAALRAQMALVLERERPSRPSLEAPIRRQLAECLQAERDYAEAALHWRWLERNGPGELQTLAVQELKTNQNLRAKSQVEQAQQQLQHARQLSDAGNYPDALVHSREAVRQLEKLPEQRVGLVRAHRLVTLSALQVGSSQLALQSLQALQRLDTLTRQERGWLGQLQKAQPVTVAPKPVASEPATQNLPVNAKPVRSKFGGGAQYPTRAATTTIARPDKSMVPKRTVLEVIVEEAEPEPAARPRVGSRRPQQKIELPRLRLNNSNGMNRSTTGTSGYPGQTGDTLPSYQRGSVSNDRLPGY